MTPASKNTYNRGVLPKDSLGEPLDSLSIELGRISAEIQSINSGFQAHMQQVLLETRTSFESHFQTRLDQCIDEVRERIRLDVRSEIEREYQAEAAKRQAHIAIVNKEIERINSEMDMVGDEITKMLEDPSVELSKVMRKHTKQAELKAYLGGLRVGLGEDK